MITIMTEKTQSTPADETSLAREATVNADAFQRRHESLRSEVFCIFHIAGVCRMIAIDARHMAPI